MKKVSVVVPCYNQADFLGEALESVKAQSYSFWECIVVNDGSTDETETIARAWCQRDERFRYLWQENSGPSEARNMGVKYGDGEYILPLDADDRIGKEYLSDAVSILRREPDVGIVYCEAELFGTRSGKWNLEPFDRIGILLRNSIFCSAFFRRSDYEKTKGYNRNMADGYEDWDFWLTLLELGVKVVKIPRVHFYYRIRQESRTVELWSSYTIKQSMYNQIVSNHLGMYFGTLGNPIELTQRIKQLEGERENIMNSRTYRLAKYLSCIARLVKRSG